MTYDVHTGLVGVGSTSFVVSIDRSFLLDVSTFMSVLHACIRLSHFLERAVWVTMLYFIDIGPRYVE